MMWSFSAHGTFRKCPRQWFYRRVYASPRAKDPLRREAHRLSKLEGIQAWRGKIVDTVISETIVPSIMWKRPCALDDAKKRAEQLFGQQRAQRIASDGDGGSFEAEYGMPLTDEMLGDALRDIHTAVENFYKAEPVWALLTRARALVPQRTLSFRHGDITVQVRPDLITFHASQPPVVFDWKVNTRPLRDYWLQLVTGAIALTRCTPHKDWPSRATQHSPNDIQLLEVQLLTGDTRTHRVSPADIEDAEDFISASASDMQFACGDDDADETNADDFPVTNNPFTCQICSFRRLCWGPVP